jgi:hypothetical protein
VLDLFGPRFVLLTGSGPAARAWHTAAAGLPLDAHALPDVAACAAYGITPEGAVLVRPDGYVAWRSPTVLRGPAAAVAAALGGALRP